MDNLERLEMRRDRNKFLEKAGVCMPSAGLIYMVSERDIEDFKRINIDFSKRRLGDGTNLFYEKIYRLVLTILMSRVVPAFAMLYILREVIISGSIINARSKAIEHNQLEVIERLNIARTKLPVVPHADANEEMNEASDCLDSLCFEFVTPYNILCNLETWVPCSITIIVGMLHWYCFIWF